MASTETYTEAKQMEQQQQHSEPHISKSTVLKVSIHCEGCKRKVKKILQGVHGVYDINIDLRQQKVVVTGNVTSDILIRKLTKAGKHVELWPEQPDSKNNNKKKKKQDEKPRKQNDPENDSEINESGVNDNETGKIKVDETSKNVQSSSNTAKNNDGSGAVTGTTGVVQVQEPPKVAEVRQTVVLPAGPVPEKKVNVAVQFPNENEEASANEKIGGANNNNGGGGGNKKKKKKGKVMMNNNNGNESVPVTAASAATVNVEHCGEAPVNAGSGYRSQGHFHGTVHSGSVPFSNPANESPPRHHMHYQQYPPNYYAPPPVHAHATASVCTVSHHTAYPSSSSYGAAYYAPPQPYSYAHVVRPGTGEMEPRPYTYESESYSYTSSSQPSDSFEFFSDENPNACSVM